jgi:uncharacterized protein (TIGR02145 family)
MQKIRRYTSFLLLLNVVVFLIPGCGKDDKESAIVDADGNIYHSVVIGNQTWMTENLKTTRYRDGSAIANITDSAEWENYQSGAYCNYDNVKSIGKVYGRLYNWTAANSGVLAPVGWHVPSKEEWDTLIDYLGGIDVAGERLKAIVYAWSDPYLDRSLRSGFNAYPGGLRGFHPGSFDFFNIETCWWTSTEENASWAWYIGVFSYTSAIKEDNFFKSLGLYVRCIKD